MKHLIIFFLLLSVTKINGQSEIKVIKSSLENGISVRNMIMETVHSTENNKDKSFYLPENKISCNYMRFYEFEPLKNESGYVGKVFMSERYEDEVFAKKFERLENFKSNKNGYYMICKIFISDGFYKINIYPNFELNVCNKKEHKIHKNAKLGGKYVLQDGLFCNDKSYQNDTKTPEQRHYNKFEELVTLRDYESEDFWNRGNELYKKEINYAKMIKCFRINTITTNDSISILGFELEYTKNAKSNDKSYLTKYSYDYRPYEVIASLGTYFSFIGHYKSQNKIPTPIDESKDAEPLKYFINKGGLYYRKSLDFGVYDISKIDTTELISQISRDEIKSMSDSYVASIAPALSMSFMSTSSSVQLQDTSIIKKGYVYLGTFEVGSNKPVKSGFISEDNFKEGNTYIVRKNIYLYATSPVKSQQNKKIIGVIEKDRKIIIKDSMSIVQNNLKKIWAEVVVLPK